MRCSYAMQTNMFNSVAATHQLSTWHDTSSAAVCVAVTLYKQTCLTQLQRHISSLHGMTLDHSSMCCSYAMQTNMFNSVAATHQLSTWHDTSSAAVCVAVTLCKQTCLTQLQRHISSLHDMTLDQQQYVLQLRYANKNV